MGKKKQLKLIRKLAAQMPSMETTVIKKYPVSGKELIERGVKEVEGKPVDPLKQYMERKPEKANWNHNRKMKQLYNKHGIMGVDWYVGKIDERKKDASLSEMQKIS